MKKLLELLLCFLHPVAMILIWVSLLLRSDMGLVPRLTWGSPRSCPSCRSCTCSPVTSSSERRRRRRRRHGA
jgi:hypothetical protein